MSSTAAATADSTLVEVEVVDNGGPGKGERAMGWWLVGCCGLVVGMVSLGGVTRLTGSPCYTTTCFIMMTAGVG
jgi:hypothetical protein